MIRKLLKYKSIKIPTSRYKNYDKIQGVILDQHITDIKWLLNDNSSYFLLNTKIFDYWLIYTKFLVLF